MYLYGEKIVFLCGTAQMRRNRMPFISSYQRTVRNPLINFNPVVETRPFCDAINLCPADGHILLLKKKNNVLDDVLAFL